MPNSEEVISKTVGLPRDVVEELEMIERARGVKVNWSFFLRNLVAEEVRRRRSIKKGKAS